MRKRGSRACEAMPAPRDRVEVIALEEQKAEKAHILVLGQRSCSFAWGNARNAVSAYIQTIESLDVAVWVQRRADLGA